MRYGANPNAMPETKAPAALPVNLKTSAYIAAAHKGNVRSKVEL